ncbi:hypothetical protein Tco_1380215 [Tanacetum coccineum]
MLNVNLLIVKIEALIDNPTASSDFVTKSFSTSLNFFLEETNTFDNSLPESETFCFNLEEISSGSPTSYLDLSLPDYEAFFCDSEPDSGNFTMDVVEDIFDNPTREPRVHVPNVLPTIPPFHWIRISLFLRFLLLDKFSISFIHDPPFPVIDTLLPFSSENEDKVVNPGILAAGEEQSPLFAYVIYIFLAFLTYPVSPPYLLSIGNEDTIFDPDISIYHSFMPGGSYQSGTFMKFNDCPDFEASRAHGFVLRSLEL